MSKAVAGSGIERTMTNCVSVELSTAAPQQLQGKCARIIPHGVTRQVVALKASGPLYPSLRLIAMR